jgi:hypothetical protein
MPRTPNHTPPPDLATLATPPSWHNRAGRVDRSCCFTLTAAELWRRIPDDGWRATAPPAHGGGQATPSPRGVVKRPDRVGTLALTAEQLWLIHRNQQPAPLRGDFRTPKSNAFKPGEEATRWWNAARAQGTAGPGPGVPGPPGGPAACDAAAKKTPNANPLAGRPATPTPLDPPAVNPTRGAGFSMGLKMLGLPADWSTTLTVERYAQHAKLKQHFLICPVCAAAAAHVGETQADSRRPTDAGRHAPGRTQPSGARRSPANQTPPSQRPSGGLPPGRVTKLYLPLCTPREWEDARLAHLWVLSHTDPNRPYTRPVLGLLERYAELFPGRKLRCRQCLGLRYGEVKRPTA